jgi:capsular polysaccharide biosynthesis protein
MNKTPVYEENFASLNLIQLIKKWKKQLLIVAAIALVLSFIFTLPFFIPPMYKSTAIAYPVNLSSYSTESPTEQLLQLFESDEIKLELIKDFNLYSHYEIDSTKKAARTTIFKQLTGNISINKTDYESVKIEVMDTDPVQAKQMVDSIIEKGNRLARKLYREKVMEAYIVAKTQFDLKKAEIDSMDKVLTELRLKSGIVEFSQQTREISRAYYTSVLNKNNNPRLDEMFNKMQQYGSDYVTLNERINYTRSVYNNYKQYVENATKDLTKELTYSNVVTEPLVADKKAYPLRSLIMLMFTASVVFLSFVIIVIYENTLEKKPVK